MLSSSRGLFEDEEGVSEVVGTILTLAITVVLFTSVYAGVSTLEEPEERDHVDITADLERVGGTNYINATHRGGKQLQFDSLAFTVLVDGESNLVEEEPGVELVKSGDTWTVGKEITIRDPGDDLGIVGASTIELVIQNRETNRVVYSAVLAEKGTEILGIKRSYIMYKHDWRNYAEQGENIDIVAEINEAEGEKVWVNATASKDVIEEGKKIRLDNKSGNMYSNESLTINVSAEEGSYTVKITAETLNRTVNEHLRLNIGKRPAVKNPKNLEIGNIDYRPRSPSHSDSFTLEVEVYNQGPFNYTTNWTVKDTYDGDSEEVYEDTTEFRSGPAPTVIRPTFTMNGSGQHEVNIDISTDDEWEGASRTIAVHVDPHVLIVEDRSADGLGEAELMSNALSGLNLDHNVREPESESDLNLIDYEEHSVVIWMTGNESGQDPLLEEATDDLVNYIEDNNGSVWLRGAYDLDALDLGNLYDKLGYTGFGTKYDGNGGERTLEGHVNGTYGDFEFNITSMYDYYDMSLKDDIEDKNRLQDENGNNFGIGYQPAGGQRTAIDSFLFRSIADPGFRANLASEVIEWLTNITTRGGVDVSVTSQTIDPEAPMYLDPINITATFRNNGPRDLTLNNTARLVRNDGEEVISPPSDANLFLKKNGGTASVTFTWKATELGVQKFIVQADYFGQIDEVNLVNNDITYKNLEISDDDIYANVHYSTLVVDADLSDQNGYNDTAKEVVNSFQRLGYDEEKDYDIYEVGMENSDVEDGPTNETMADYNAVFWVTGNRGDTYEVFTPTDIDNINNYLDNGANMMFIGENILDDLADNPNNAEEALIEYLGIDSIGSDVEAETLKGQEDNSLGHNLRYRIDKGQYDSFTPVEEENILFKNENGDNIASTYDDGSTKTAYMGVNPENITGPLASDKEFEDWPVGEVGTDAENARDEFVYTSLWNFGKDDDRTELRITDYDVKLSSNNPRTSKSYLIRATVENIGYKQASALVRFKEGDNHIGARTPSIPGSERESVTGSTYIDVEPGTTTVEISWQPTVAGTRPLMIRVDPISETEEISYDDGEKIMEFNNQAKIDQPVYFFYDDMEEDRENWEHDSTVVNIDGTGPLDFVDRRDVNTNVEGEWDGTYSGMTEKDGIDHGGGYYETDNEDVSKFTDGASYSSPRSYWMPETPGAGEERKPIDLFLVIDESGSMSGSRIDNAILGAQEAVGMLREGDRVTVYGFDSDIDKIVDAEYTNDSTDRQNINTTIKNELSPGGATSLFDATSWAVYDMDNVERNSVKGLITLTDGISNYDYRTESTDEKYKYAPGGGDGEEPDEQGTVQQYSDGNGLLGIPYNVFTVTIGNQPEARMHSISATSQADISYGVYESDSAKLGNLFQMFVTELVDTSRGGIKSDPIDPSETNTKEQTLSTSSQGNLMANTVENTKFMVFSDGFRTKDWTVPGYDDWLDTTDFSHWESDYRTWVRSDDQGSYIRQQINPSDTLTNLAGNYEIEGAHIDFLQYGEDLAIDISTDGINWDTVYISDPDGYDSQEISSYVNGADSFQIRFRHAGANGYYLYLDDVSVTYELDYTPSEDEDLDTPDGYDININNKYRYLTTPSVDVTNTRNEELSFRTKHWMMEGTNGGVIYLWGRNDTTGGWTWQEGTRRYVKPDQSYTGNLDFDKVANDSENGGPKIAGSATGLKDREGDLPYWSFNGKSAGGTFGWRYVNIDLARYERFMEDFSDVRVVFVTAQMGGARWGDGWQPEMGWYIDNINFRVTRNSTGEIPQDQHGYWMKVSQEELMDEKGFDLPSGHDEGDYYDHTNDDENGRYWLFARKNSDDEVTLPKGIDSSLYTPMITLSNAENPVLNAKMKFNMDDSSGLPPDGLRIEVSNDNGRTWDSITYGIRSGWNASGTDAVSGEAYSGTTEAPNSEYGWIDTTTLTRLNADLSGWRGENIIIRFRVFTNLTERYDDVNLPKGIFIDDVVVQEKEMNNGLADNVLVDDQESAEIEVEPDNGDHDIVSDRPLQEPLLENKLEYLNNMDIVQGKVDPLPEILDMKNKDFVSLERRRRIWF